MGRNNRINIPPGESDRLVGGLPRVGDDDISVRPLLDEMENKEKRALGLRR